MKLPINHGAILITLLLNIGSHAQEHGEAMEEKEDAIEISIDTLKQGKLKANDLSKEDFVAFYEENKSAIWKEDPEGKLWKSFVPLVLSYDDKTLMRMVLQDVSTSEFARGSLFGWDPLVHAAVSSKMPFLLELIHAAEGAEGVEKFYAAQKAKVFNHEDGSVADPNSDEFAVLVGVICSLPKVEKEDEKKRFFGIIMDAFELMQEHYFEGKDMKNSDATYIGMKNGLMGYYLHSDDNKLLTMSYDREDSPHWPYRSRSFDIRAYYEELMKRDEEELKDDQVAIIRKIQGMRLWFE